MGFLQERYRVELAGATPPGTCPECAVSHNPVYPHNKDSLAYQYKFYDKNGRWPTWADAMAHCPEDVKQVWIRELSARGVSIDGESKGDEGNAAAGGSQE
ncbi:hypothetical protein FACS189447_03210 [Spirochaetia bacterium]|nr:hypothetical protein FACS189447_03210 [Spirochaetia bacterium]